MRAISAWMQSQGQRLAAVTIIMRGYLTRDYFRRRKATTLNRLENQKMVMTAWMVKHSATTMLLILGVLIIASGLATPSLQVSIGPYFEASNGEKLLIFRNLIATVGGALIGATAIVFSVVMIAVQINFARMPYGLFRRLSSDFQLLSYVATTFILAVIIAATALVPSEKWIAAAVFISVWGTLATLVLFLLAYRRTLSLINPIFQVRLIVEAGTKNLKWWDRRATRTVSLLALDEPKTKDGRDANRVAFFLTNPSWTSIAKQSVAHAMSFAKNYGVQGDYEVSRVALSGVIVLNAAYIAAKGKTFFGVAIMGDSPFTSDAFINDSLEHLRQQGRNVVARKNEAEIELVIQAFANLAKLYVTIDYADQHTRHTFHAKLAFGYLGEFLLTVIPLNMPDVLMSGVNAMGDAAEAILQQGEPSDATIASEKMSPLAAVGIASTSSRAVTMTVMERLTRLLLKLFTSNDHDIKFAADRLQSSIEMIATFALESIPDEILSSPHRLILGPYYSLLSQRTFPYWLSETANSLLGSRAGDANAARLARNIAQWSEDLSKGHRAVFLKALEKRSGFARDLVHWTCHVSMALSAISQSESCGDRTREKLNINASNLIYVLSWTPDELEAVNLVGSADLPEDLFRLAADATRKGCSEVIEASQKMLIWWGFERSHHDTGWAWLEESIYALATVALMDASANKGEELKVKITGVLGKGLKLTQQSKDHTAREIVNYAHRFTFDSNRPSAIHASMKRVDTNQLRILLIEIAQILSPGTSPEPDPRSSF